MTAHPDFIESFDRALRDGVLPPGLTARDAREVGRRFDVYRNNVAVGLTQALAARFPVIRRLVGEDFFAAVARLYREAGLPKSPVLAEWGEGFAAFLDRFPPLAAYRYMGDVARIEHARGRAFHAADVLSIDPACLAAVDPGRLRLGLHPAVILLALAHPAVSIWQRNQPGRDDAPLAAGPQTALILRDRGFDVPVRALGEGDATFLAALLDGALLAEAAVAAQTAESGHNPQSLLVALMRSGTIVKISEQ